MLFTEKDDSVKKVGQQTTESLSIYHGNNFSINQPEDWQDGTVYTLLGPIEDDIQHNILITCEEDVPFDSVVEYADWQIEALENELKGCRLLNRGGISLANGLSAYQVIFRWYPTDEVRIYQKQVFILVGNTGYKLTATFTKKTRKTLGTQVERILMSFQPDEGSPNKDNQKERI